MTQKKVDEALFWKHLSDTLLEHMQIDKKDFYKQLKPIKSVWEIKDADKMAREIQKFTSNRTQYLRESFRTILVEIDNAKKD